MGSHAGFSVTKRNAGHWDFTARDEGRLFRLRGGPGDWRVFDERKIPAASPPQTSYREQGQAVAYIMAELMYELLAVDGASPRIMESWNVSDEALRYA